MKNKFPIIPPLFHCNKFIPAFQEKATLFNNYLVSQCTVLNTGNQLPLFRTTNESILNKILFNDDDIITHIRGLHQPCHTHNMKNQCKK